MLKFYRMHDLILFKPSTIINQFFMKLNVLLVEDNEFNIKYTSFMLESAGCLVILAKNGKEAIQNYLSNYKNIDLIILDIEMPIMDGYQTLKVLREEFQNNLCFVCGCSTLINNENYESLGFNAFINKSPRSNEIIKLLQKVKDFKKKQ